MDAISIVAVAIVLSAVVLMAAAGFSLGAEKPPVATRRVRPVPLKLWCPVTAQPTWAGIAPAPGNGGLTVVWCDRFPAGPVECDRACLPAKAAA